MSHQIPAGFIGDALTCRISDEATQDSTGIPFDRSEPLYMLVPMFSFDDSKNPSDAFNPALGTTLINLFGVVPEGFKTRPFVSVQSPNAEAIEASINLFLFVPRSLSAGQIRPVPPIYNGHSCATR